jgi:chromosome segregation ATPase
MATAAIQEVDRELQATKTRLNTVNQYIQTRQQTIDNLKNKINIIKTHLNQN